MSNDVKTVGELLKAARDAQGLSIESIAKDICVRSSYLTAIESDNYNELPEKTFAVGFVRAYAMALKADAKAIVEQFKNEFPAAEAPATISPEIVAPAPRRGMPAWLSPVAGVLGVSLCWALFGGSIVPFSTADNQIIDRNTDVAQLQAVQASLPVAAEAVEPDTMVSATQQDLGIKASAPELQRGRAMFTDTASLFTPAAIAGQAVEAGSSDFRLTATEDSWVRLAKTDGTEVWSGVLREGQSYRPHLDGATLLSTSNAGGVSLSFGQQELAALGQRGEVIQDVRLDGERLFSHAPTSNGSATGSR